MNLINTLTDEVSKGTTLSSISQKLGIDQDQAATGFKAIIPAVLAGVIHKSAGPGSVSSLSSIFTGNPLPVDTDPEIELHNESNLLDRGKGLIQNLFGSHEAAVNNAVSQSTGLSTEKSSSLLVMVVPLITGYIGNLIARENWSMPDFIAKLFNQKDDIEAALPGGLSTSLGMASAVEADVQPAVDTTVPPVDDHISPEENIVPPIENAVPPIETTVPHSTLAPEPKSASGAVLKWIIIIALLALAAWYFMGQKGCNNDMNNTTGNDTLATTGYSEA